MIISFTYEIIELNIFLIINFYKLLN